MAKHKKASEKATRKYYKLRQKAQKLFAAHGTPPPKWTRKPKDDLKESAVEQALKLFAADGTPPPKSAREPSTKSPQSATPSKSKLDASEVARKPKSARKPSKSELDACEVAVDLAKAACEASKTTNTRLLAAIEGADTGSHLIPCDYFFLLALWLITLNHVQMPIARTCKPRWQNTRKQAQRQHES